MAAVPVAAPPGTRRRVEADPAGTSPTTKSGESYRRLTAPPVFRLPRHRVAHTRHYMPWEKKGPADKTLVFDTFVAVGRTDPLYVTGRTRTCPMTTARSWPASFADCPHSGGPRGGWRPRLTDDLPGEPNCTPAGADDPSRSRSSARTRTRRSGTSTDPTKLKKGERLFDCPRWHLCLDTETIHAERWPRVLAPAG